MVQAFWFSFILKEQDLRFFLIKYVSIFSEWEMHIVDLHEANSSSPWCLENECWSFGRKQSQIHKLRVIHHQ